MSTMASPLRRWLLAFLLVSGGLLSACSDEVEVGAKGEATSGDEDLPEGDGWAKLVPKQEGEATEAGAKQAAPAPPQKSAAPTYKAPPVAQSGGPPPPSGNSAWGAPEAQSGRALPKRKAMNEAAKRSYQQGLQHAARGDDARARQSFEAALNADKNAYQAAYNLGVVLDRLGQTDKALSAYNRALKIQPDYELAVLGVVNIYRRQGSPGRGVSFAEPIARKWVRNLYLQAILADAYTSVDRVDDAENTARAALRRDERFVPAMISLAKASLKRGREELAESILEQALKIDANHPELHFLQGEAHEREGQLGLALASYRRAVELRPDYAEARMKLGIQYMAGGNYAQAREQFLVAARLVPSLVAAHLNLGDAYRANRQWKEAKRSLDQALRMQSNLPEAHFNLGLMYLAAGDQFPGLSTLDALQRATLELNNYRNQMGPRLKKDDPSTAYLADISKRIEREQKRIEREKKQKEREARRKAQQGGG